jgi:DNA-binding NarL/FixJ family response regulator
MANVTADQLRRAQDRYLRTTTGAREERDKVIARALAAGWSQRQVAKATGLTNGRISQIVQGSR